MRLASPSEQDARKSYPRKKCKSSECFDRRSVTPCSEAKALDIRVVANYVRALEYGTAENEKSASRHIRDLNVSTPAMTGFQSLPYSD